MNCPNCGAANEPDARFCAECGAPLTSQIDEDVIIIDHPPQDDADRTILSSRRDLAAEETVIVDEAGEIIAEAEEVGEPEDVEEVPPTYEPAYIPREPEPVREVPPAYESVYTPPEPEPAPPPPPPSGPLTGDEGPGGGFWSQRNIIIIVVILLVLLCCCCTALAIGSFIGSGGMDEMMRNLS